MTNASVTADSHSVVADGHSAFVVSLTTNDNNYKEVCIHIVILPSQMTPAILAQLPRLLMY